MTYFDLSNSNFQKKKSQRIKILGITLVAICCALLLFLLTNILPFLKSFLLGVFGLAIYPISLITLCIGIALINNKKYVMPFKYVLYLCVVSLCVLMLINLCVLGNPNNSFTEYLALTYNFKYTGGGLLAGVFLAPFLKTVGIAGSAIIVVVVFVVFTALIIDFLRSIKTFGYKKPEKIPTTCTVEPIKPEKPTPKIKEKKTEEFNLFIDEKLEEEQNKSALIKLGLLEGNIEPEKPAKKELSIREQLLTPQTQVDLSYLRTPKPATQTQPQEIQNNINLLKNEQPKPSIFSAQPPKFEANYPLQPQTPIFEQPIKSEPKQIFENNQKISNFFGNNTESNAMPKAINDYSQTPTYKPIKKFVDFQDEKPAVPVVNLQTNYNMPPIDLLEKVEFDFSSLNENVVGKRALLENTLETFGVNAKVIGVVVGPSVTRYELEMPQGVSVKKILALDDDIAMAMASRAGVRIEAPIPGKSAVGIEVPNDKIATVTLREILESNEYQQNNKRLTFALGKDIAGKVQTCDLTKMPHLLVAGATNSGKSICLNTIITSLIYRNSPEDLRLILIDPKRVEFALYNDLPHLLIPSIITDVDKAVNALTWAIGEMERRYELLQMARCKKFEEFNQMPEILSGEQKKLPYVVIVVDELADLMSTNKKDLEEKIKRLAQKGRAAGIHLVLATQRPSVDVITGTIKANFPSRISFALTSLADSRTILDQTGAENLLGKGDMLYFPTGESSPKRIQGCFVSNDEVENIVEYIKQYNVSDFDEEIEKHIEKSQTQTHGGNYEGAVGDPNFDPFLPQVLKMFIENKQASTTAIQRRFLVGFPRASRILDQLQQMGYVSAPDGTKPRNVLITMEEFVEKFGIIE